MSSPSPRRPAGIDPNRTKPEATERKRPTQSVSLPIAGSIGLSVVAIIFSIATFVRVISSDKPAPVAAPQPAISAELIEQVKTLDKQLTQFATAQVVAQKRVDGLSKVLSESITQRSEYNKNETEAAKGQLAAVNEDLNLMAMMSAINDNMRRQLGHQKGLQHAIEALLEDKAKNRISPEQMDKAREFIEEAHRSFTDPKPTAAK